MKYAGIGARMTPTNHLTEMHEFAARFARAGHRLRTGGAKGADEAFALGCIVAGGECQIFRPSVATDQMLNHASLFHPAWDKLSDYVKRLMGRNSAILLGENLDDPVDFVVCWTPGGRVTGGTGHGLRIAETYRIPVYNLYHPETLKKLETLT